MRTDHPALISGLDHAVLLCPEIDMGVAVYAAVLGREADWRAQADGVATALFRLGNMSLELMAPASSSPAADRLSEIIREEGPGLKSLAFATPDMDAAHRTFTRRGLAPSEITEGSSRNSKSHETRTWRRFRCEDDQTAGLRVFVLENTDPLPAPKETGPENVHALDHLVINTDNPDRALGLFGAKLGLRLALDRSFEAWGARLIFFRTGGLTLEIAYQTGETANTGRSDMLWGLSWQVGDLDAAHARLSRCGLQVSEIRTGRKPGSRVFTLRDGTMNVPTLFISHGGA